MEWLRNLTPCLWEDCQQQTDTLEVCAAQNSMTLFLPRSLSERPRARETERRGERERDKTREKRENEDLSYEPMCGLTHVCIKPSEVSTSP